MLKRATNNEVDTKTGTRQQNFFIQKNAIENCEEARPESSCLQTAVCVLGKSGGFMVGNKTENSINYKIILFFVSECTLFSFMRCCRWETCITSSAVAFIVLNHLLPRLLFTQQALMVWKLSLCVQPFSCAVECSHYC